MWRSIKLKDSHDWWVEKIWERGRRGLFQGTMSEFDWQMKDTTETVRENNRLTGWDWLGASAEYCKRVTDSQYTETVR
jgi:hypothetical protein